jgi:tyrosyl-tRNA synthetase
MDMKNVKFVWTSDEINKNSSTYWPKVLDIAATSTLSRVKKCSKIMGREESDNLLASQIFYPVMQCADIFHLKADICQLGMDQRKVNMLARDYCEAKKIKNKPIILSHRIL